MLSLFSRTTTKNFDEGSLPPDIDSAVTKSSISSSAGGGGRRRASSRRVRHRPPSTTSKASLASVETAEERGEERIAKGGLTSPESTGEGEKLSPLEVERRNLAAKRQDLAEGERLLRQVRQKESEVRRKEARVEQIRTHLEREIHDLDRAHEELIKIKHTQAYKTQVTNGGTTELSCFFHHTFAIYCLQHVNYGNCNIFTLDLISRQA